MRSNRLPALAIFLGSFLLFGIQPMLGRTLLPSFGGTAAVWTVCLAAYQILLLVGYFYAHLVSRATPTVQRRTHIGLLALGVIWAFGFAAVRLVLRPRLGNFPIPSVEVLFCVLLFVGLPYVLLSANSTLIQVWLSAQDKHASRKVYGLYAISNLGSLLGLLAYPFLVEPFLSLDVQWYGFAGCLLFYTGLLAWVGQITSPKDSRLPIPDSRLPAPDSRLPTPLTRPWLWFALPAISTFLLNAVTMHLSTDFTPIPMLWALLLTAFLISYVIGFSRIGEQGLVVWVGLAALAVAGASFVSGVKGDKGFMLNFITGFAMILFCCTCLHSWLYRIRPCSAHLTRFYLGLASGGAAGGVSSSLLAPLVFDRVLEYPLALLLVCASCFWLVFLWRHRELKGINDFLMVLVVIAAFTVIGQSFKESIKTVARSRNFYGCLRVSVFSIPTKFGEPQTLHSLHHGDTLHGMQYREPYLRDKATSYFGSTGGGLAITSHPRYISGAPLRVGIIGLGAGTMAVHGRSNDVYRFYEINPQVIAFAANTNYFSFLADSHATIETVLGDARKVLEAERSQHAPLWDVLVMDAYSGDSIPLHLATREAFQLYMSRLSPDGILAVHISNWHIDLAPLCKAAAREFSLQIVGTIAPSSKLLSASRWVFLTRGPLAIPNRDVRKVDWEQVSDINLPLDEKGSVLHLIRFGATPPIQKLDFFLPGTVSQP